MFPLPGRERRNRAASGRLQLPLLSEELCAALAGSHGRFLKGEGEVLCLGDLAFGVWGLTGPGPFTVSFTSAVCASRRALDLSLCP